MNHRLFVLVGLVVLGGGILGGCATGIVPLQPLQRVELWVPNDGGPAIQLSPPTTLPANPEVATTGEEASAATPATAPGTASRPASSTQAAATQTAASGPATQAAAATPSTLPAGQKVVKIIDPNQTEKFVYLASYDNVWRQAMGLLANTGFTLDRLDYRLGVMTTQPLPSSQIVEFWKPQQTSARNAMENTINSQQRSVRLTIAKVPGKPEFYQIAVQVLVERETNPSGTVGGPVFVEGSGLGRSPLTLRTDYAPVTPEAPRWVILGHDPELERKLIEELFKRI